MTSTKYTSEEVASRGEELYQRRIRGLVEAGNTGRFLVLDIETGEFEVDDDDLQATKRMLSRLPDAELYGIRIGYPSAYTLGGQPGPSR